MSGEKQNGRDIIDKVAKAAIDKGVDPARAVQKAREARLRNEQRDRGER